MYTYIYIYIYICILVILISGLALLLGPLVRHPLLLPLLGRDQRDFRQRAYTENQGAIGFVMFTPRCFQISNAQGCSNV